MLFQSVTVSIVADLVFCFADVTDAGMTKCDQMADSIGLVNCSERFCDSGSTQPSVGSPSGGTFFSHDRRIGADSKSRGLGLFLVAAA